MTTSSATTTTTTTGVTNGAGGQVLTDEVAFAALGVARARVYVFDGHTIVDPCPTCGHQAQPEPTPLPAGDPVVDVVPDRGVLAGAARVVGWLVEVADQRRPARQVRDLAAPSVLRYIDGLPVGAGGNRGGVRLVSVRAWQPHEGAVEVAGAVQLQGGRRALAASFDFAHPGRWVCQTLRVL